MNIKNWDKFTNMYSSFCKVDVLAEKKLKQSKIVILEGSHKNITKKPLLGILTYAAIYLISPNFSRKIKLKKPSSFFRTRSKYFWGYKSYIAGNFFYYFYKNFSMNILQKSLYFGFSKKKTFFFGKTKIWNIKNCLILDELSETNFFKYKGNLGVSCKFYFLNKNYINFY